MSKKHPGRDTDYAKWTSTMRKLDNELTAFKNRLRKEAKEGDVRKAKKRVLVEDDEQGEI